MIYTTFIKAQCINCIEWTVVTYFPYRYQSLRGWNTDQKGEVVLYFEIPFPIVHRCPNTCLKPIEYTAVSICMNKDFTYLCDVEWNSEDVISKDLTIGYPAVIYKEGFAGVTRIPLWTISMAVRTTAIRSVPSREVLQP